MNMKKLNIYLVLIGLFLAAMMIFYACSPAEEPKVSEAEAAARLKVAEAERTSTKMYEPVTNLYEEETLDWDHEANSWHGWTYFWEADQRNSVYEGVHCITDETSAQWAWLQGHDWSYDADGVCRYDGRYLVALAPEFGGVGDYVDLLFETGEVFKCIIVDEKADCETYGHRKNGSLNIIELIVSPEWYEQNHDNIKYPDVIAWRYANE